ncbi:MAG: NAD(P)H-dependent oxidoreductase, partial [Pseudomonadales bacterium]
MKNLLIVWHSQSGNTAQLMEAVRAGAEDHAIEDVTVRCLRAPDAGPEDLRWADGLLFGTPENFGTMSGLLKDFFDRTFYAVEGELAPLPYALFISAGNDGRGAVREIERIARRVLAAIEKPFILAGQAHFLSASIGVAVAPDDGAAT